MANGVPLQFIFKQVYHLAVYRYVTIAGTTLLAYDTILTIKDEFCLVWSWFPLFISKRTQGTRPSVASMLLRMLYLFNRYAMITVATFSLIFLLPKQNLNGKKCETLSLIIGRTDVWIEVIGSGVVLHWLTVLWGFGRKERRLIAFTFVIAKSITIAFAYKGISEFQHSNTFNPALKVCSISTMPKSYLGSWIPAAVFDALVIILLLLNTLSRPRVESERLLKLLYSDGVIFFLSTFCMRMLNVFLMAFAQDPSVFYMGVIFSTSIVTVAASRTFLRLFKLAAPQNYDPSGSQIELSPCENSGSAAPRCSRSSI